MKGEPMMTTGGRVLSVNVGRVREFEYNRRLTKSAIWKSPIAGRVQARGVNLEGDEQADPKAHGGPDKAVYAYSIEDTQWWEEKLGRSLQYGEFGENLTTQGIEVNDAVIGERWEIGTAVLEVSEPRVPCWRLGVRMKDEMFPRRFTEALRPGAYLRIIVEGDLGAGDEIRVVDRPAHDLTVRDVFRIYTHDRNEIERLVSIPGISESWRKWAENRLQKAKDGRADATGPECC
jgi:MOSC domain-containing protein YiiM